jgi:diadenosine tetraphosphate (Ap4A) HIT family hydrolase
MPDDGCIFCSVLADQAPATFVYRDERCAALMDIRPVTPGHVVVVPATHAANLTDLDAEGAAHLMRVAHAIAAAQRKSKLRCEGVTLLVTDGAAAGQEVFHTHLHVFPRYRLDGFGLTFGPNYAYRPRDELEDAAKKLRPHIPADITKLPR